MPWPKCHVCDGEFIGEQPLPPTEGTTNGRPTLWCEDCLENFRWACWDEDEQGPFVPKITHIRPRWPRLN